MLPHLPSLRFDQATIISYFHVCHLLRRFLHGFHCVRVTTWNMAGAMVYQDASLRQLQLAWTFRTHYANQDALCFRIYFLPGFVWNMSASPYKGAVEVPSVLLSIGVDWRLFIWFILNTLLIWNINSDDVRRHAVQLLRTKLRERFSGRSLAAWTSEMSFKIYPINCISFFLAPNTWLFANTVAFQTRGMF